MRFPDPEMTMRGEVRFVDEYSSAINISGNAAAAQQTIPLADTSAFSTSDGVKGNRIIIGRGTPREEKAVIDSIDSDTSITIKTDNLAFNHSIDADTTVDTKSEDVPAGGESEFLSGGTWTAADWTSDAGGYIHDVGTVEELVMTDPGEDYKQNEILKLIDNANETCQIKVLTVDTGGEILTYQIYNKGKGYTIKEDLPTDYETSGEGKVGQDATFSIVRINNTTPLSYSKTTTQGKRFQTTVTISNRTDGYIVVRFGGVELGEIYATKTFKSYNADAEGLIITPSATFDGKVVVSIKEITKVLPVAATTNFLVGEEVIVNVGKADEVKYTIASVQAGTSLTFTESLKRTHVISETVNQYGIGGTVEVCWKEASEPIAKTQHRNVLFYIPANWTDAKLTFLVSDEINGTYSPMEFIIPVWDSEDSEIVFDTTELITGTIQTGGSKEYVFSWGGALRDVLAGLPYIKLLSGEVGSEVDQGADEVIIRYVMTR